MMLTPQDWNRIDDLEEEAFEIIGDESKKARFDEIMAEVDAIKERAMS